MLSGEPIPRGGHRGDWPPDLRRTRSATRFASGDVQGHQLPTPPASTPILARQRERPDVQKQDTPRLRVLLCDSNELYRAGIRAVLERAPDISVVGEASDAREAVEAARRSRPDVALLDLELAGEGAAGIIAEIVECVTGTAVLAQNADERAMALVLEQGARGYLLKSLPATQFLACIGLLAHGHLILPALTAEQMKVAMNAPADEARNSCAETIGLLTRRQQDVLGLVAFGLSNSEIAGKLHVSEATVKSHISAMLRRLGLRDRTQLTVYAYRTAGMCMSAHVLDSSFDVV
jgi:DNA-binding NarL/FixJ family response regulator